MAEPPSLVTILLVVAAIVGAIVGIVKGSSFLYSRLSTFFRAQNAAAELIAAQLVRNGGHTLLDNVDRISGNHAEAERHWTRLEQRIAEDHAMNEDRWTEWGAQTAEIKGDAKTIASDLAAHRTFVAAQHKDLSERLEKIEAKLT